jgi:galacturonosyltransferase
VPVFPEHREYGDLPGNSGSPAERTVLVGGSGVDLARHAAAPFPGHEGSETRFLYVGRLMKEKGTEEYLGAAERMHEKYGQKVSFCTIGYSDESSYREKVEKAQQEGYLTVIPFQKDIAPYLSEADAVVPSFIP